MPPSPRYHRAILGLLFLLLGGAMKADEAEASGRTAEAWVAQLADEDFDRRTEASEALRAMGPESLAALQKASESSDPEVRMRARSIRRYLAPMKLVGTVWNFSEPESEDYRIEFLAQGVLKTHHPNDTTEDNDRWRIEHQEGSPPTLVLEINDGYAIKTAPLTGTRIAGIAVNRVKTEWHWTAKRIKPGP